MKTFTRPLMLLPVLLAISVFGLSSAAHARYQSLGVPAYFYPAGTNLDLWSDLGNGFPTVNYLIAETPYPPNANSTNIPDYQSAVTNAQNAGVTVLGYVPTNGGATSLSTVESEVCYEMNTYNVDGIFFDQAVCSTANESYYTSLRNYVKSFFSSAIVVLNPGGVVTDSNYGTIADILVTFEGNYTSYIDGWTTSQGTSIPGSGGTDLYFSNYQGASWYSNYSNQKFWNIVYATPSSDFSNALSLSESRNAGVVYITDEIDGYTNDNGTEVPYCFYGTLPTYLSTELSDVAAY